MIFFEDNQTCNYEIESEDIYKIERREEYD